MSWVLLHFEDYYDLDSQMERDNGRSWSTTRAILCLPLQMARARELGEELWRKKNALVHFAFSNSQSLENALFFFLSHLTFNLLLQLPFSFCLFMQIW